MDYKKVLENAGKVALVIVAFVAFIIILTLIMMSLGPQAPSTPKMICDTINGTTFCHF